MTFTMLVNEGYFLTWVTELGLSRGLWQRSVRRRAFSQTFSISSDLHKESVDGPAYDLLTVMTKMLHVGMPLIDVIRAVTITPAAAIGRGNAELWLCGRYHGCRY